MAAVAVVTTQFFAAVIIAVRRGLIMTQAARLAARSAARQLERLGGSVAWRLNGTATSSQWRGDLGVDERLDVRRRRDSLGVGSGSATPPEPARALQAAVPSGTSRHDSSTIVRCLGRQLGTTTLYGTTASPCLIVPCPVVPVPCRAWAARLDMYMEERQSNCEGLYLFTWEQTLAHLNQTRSNAIKLIAA